MLEHYWINVVFFQVTPYVLPHMHQRVPTPTSHGGTRQQHLHNMRFTYIHAKVIQVMVFSGTLLCSTAFSATLKLNTHAYFEAKGLSGKWVARTADGDVHPTSLRRV